MGSITTVTRLDVRTRMNVLLGEGATTSLSTSEKNDIINEAYAAWCNATGGVQTATALFDQAVSSTDEGRAFIGDVTIATTVVVKVREILTVHDTSIIGRPLERVPLSEIVYMREVDPAASGTPTHYAVMPASDDGAQGVSEDSDWRIYFYPRVSGTFVFGFSCLYYPAKLTGDTNALRLPNHECWAVARLAAAMAAPLAGRSPELTEELWRVIPERVQMVARTRAFNMRRVA